MSLNKTIALMFLPLFVTACSHAPKAGRIISSEADPHPKKTVVTFKQPNQASCYFLSYRNLNTTLNPGESADFEVPKEYQKKAVTFVTLGHGALQSYGSGNDNSPGLTSVQFKSKRDGSWRYWGGPSSGAGGSKFAEYRGGGLELEGLYEWGHYGHYNLDTQTQSTDPLTITAMRAVSAGTDPVLLGELSVKFWPKSVERTQEFIFGTGTTFGDYQTTNGASYYTRYDSAWRIGYYGGGTHSIAGATLSSGKISIPLSAGTKLRSVEIACGDGAQGSSDPRGGMLNVRVRHADGTSEDWIRNENVPPSGILKTGSPDCDFKSAAGDVLELDGSGDTVYVNGVRLGMD